MTERHILLGVAIWLFLFGIWPVAHPDHGDGSPTAMVDALLHTLGLILIIGALASRARQKGTP